MAHCPEEITPPEIQIPVLSFSNVWRCWTSNIAPLKFLGASSATWSCKSFDVVIAHIARSKNNNKNPRCAGRVLLSTCGLNKHHYCLFKWTLTKNISHSPALGPVLNRCFSKHWQSTHSVTALHTLGRHMGQIKQGSEYRRAPAPASAAPPTEPFRNSAPPKRRPSLGVGACWGVTVEWWRVKGVVCKLSPFKFKLLSKTPWIWAYRVVRTHIPVLVSVIFIKHAHLVQSNFFFFFFFKERTLSPLCPSLSFPPFKNTFFLYKWFSHTANINI